MKISISLLLLSLSLAFGAGYIALQVRLGEEPTIDFSVSEINDLKRKFRDKHPVVNELKISDLFSPQAGFELLDPRTIFTPGRGRTFAENASVFRADKLCQPSLITSNSLKKIKTWLSFRCHQILQLPDGFFEQPPFMSPFGMSFTNLARISNLSVFQSLEWTRAQLRFFHSLELKDLAKNILFDEKRKTLSELSNDVLQSMANGQSWIGSDFFIFVRKTTESGGYFQRSTPTANYLMYKRSDWDQFLSRYRVQTKLTQSSMCAYKDDGLCWTKATVSGKKIEWTFGTLFFLAIAVIIFCVVQIIKNIQSQRFEEARKRFALQTLTHELRTPLASLVVSSEQLFNLFDQLPPSAKEPFLRMADDVQRLTRVAESSRNYLKAGDSQNLIAFNFSEVPSINEFVSSVLERFENEIVIQKTNIDGPFSLDRYWVGTCLQNLVQNALLHGSKPVIVQIKKEKNKTGRDYLVIAVVDHGQISELDLNNLAKPFVKRSKSSGLGLGLSIVDTVMTSMNSKLKISSSPTCFELQIGEIK